MERSAGILLPLFSLPSPYGIGSMGHEARAFAEFLREAGQKWWQILPVGPTGAGSSPYSSESTFAGNLLYIDLEALERDGLLTADELVEAEAPAGNVDYAALRESREALLRRAFNRLERDKLKDVRAFAADRPWVREYALYRAAKTHFGGLAWYHWPDESLRRHESAALERWGVMLREDVLFYTCLQYWFFTQWADFKRSVNEKGVKLIGDIPIYVSLDSADVWSEREQFLLNADGFPSQVAGVPPDYFSEEGQLWGNPLYDWEAQKRDGYGWWIRRMDGAHQLFDSVRIDHFRGLESYWAVPAEAKTAMEGHWEQGPGMSLLRVLRDWFHHNSYIAEDLGTLTEAVHDLRREAGFPGMKVLQFAFDNPYNAYLPHNHEKHGICYTGTHDNDTLVGWYEKAKDEEKAFAQAYLGVEDDVEAVRKAVLRSGMASVADLFVAQLQDYLGLGSESRINVPGVAEGNWAWRLQPGQTCAALAAEIRELTHTFARC